MGHDFQASPMNQQRLDIEEQLRRLRENYVAQLPAKLGVMEDLWRELNENHWPAEALELLHRKIHGIAGSGGSFGLMELSQSARLLEQVLLKLKTEQRAPSTDEHVVLRDHFTDFRKMIQGLEGGDADPQQASSPSRETPVPQQRLIYLIDADANLAEEIASQLDHFGYQVEVFCTPESAVRSCKQRLPRAFIVDVSFSQTQATGMECIKQLDLPEEGGPGVIFISSRDDLEARIEAVRNHGSAYFSKPLDINALIDRLDSLTGQQPSEPFRILIVDDAEELAEHYALVLRQKGMVVKVLTEPSTLLQNLSEFSPELILMDMYMPEYSGMELATVIRQSSAYLGVPIVYLSTETNMQVQFSAMRLGGDDFLTKPVQDERLVSAVITRAERYRSLTSMMIRDGLTGLYNHSHLKEQLVQELARARRENGELCFVMFDIDHFKAVNDSYGHPTGDRVIKSLARLLKQRLRESDIIGRYGGEEFGVIFPNTNAHKIKPVVDDLREHFAQAQQFCDETKFNVSFSAGIASFPDFDNAESLTNAADTALYTAKHAGRNCAIIANPEDSQKPA